MCVSCVGVLRSALGDDVDLNSIMEDKMNSEVIAQDIDSAVAMLAEDHENTIGGHDAGEELHYGYEVSHEYALKTHNSIVKKFKKTPTQLRLKPLRLKKKKGESTETLYAIRKGCRTLKVYDASRHVESAPMRCLFAAIWGYDIFCVIK